MIIGIIPIFLEEKHKTVGIIAVLCFSWIILWSFFVRLHDEPQELLYCSKNNDFETFSYLLLLANEDISIPMKTSIRTLKKHLPRIENTFKYTYSNGSLEGSINKIKLIKRIAYGYRNFQNYKYRILLSFKDKQKSSENQLIFAA